MRFFKDFQLAPALAVCFSLAMVFGSCRPEEPDLPPTPAPTIAGIVDDSMKTYSNPSPQPPTMVWDSMNRFAEGFDSLDMDQDGSIDLDMAMRIVNPDSQHLIALGYSAPYYKLTGRGNWRIGYYVEQVWLGMGAFMELDWASKLSLGDTVDKAVPGFTTGANLWMTPPINITYGPWYLETQTKYVGLGRVTANGTKMGWIEVDCPGREQIAIARWAYRQ